MINFEINKLTPERVDESFLKRIAGRAARQLKLKNFKEISIALMCDSRMKKLNKQYRNRDKTTDVLSFDYGEIVICVPQAKRQAKDLGHSFEKELGILLIHGILHLAGYDDKTKKEYNKMVKKQEEIWQKVI